jgi:hypothetical protein
VRLVVIALLAACEQAEQANEPSCKDVADNIAKLVQRAGDQPGDVGAMTVERCERDQWSVKKRKCLADAKRAADLADCGFGGHTVAPKLVITELSPREGDAEGGTYVAIKGRRFLKDGPRNAKVYFGSRQGQIVRFASDTEMIVQAPAGTPNETVDVLVIFDPGGQLSLKNAFKFVEKPPP